MDERQRTRASLWCDQAPAAGAWSLSRLELISTVAPRRWPVGRVDLHHKTEGPVSSVATGAGSVDAIFNALADLFKFKPTVKALSARYEIPANGQTDLPQVSAVVDLLINERIYRGTARSGDLLLTTASAYLDALRQADDERAINEGGSA